MVKAEPPARFAEIGGAVAPPGEQPFRIRPGCADNVEEVEAAGKRLHSRDLDGRVADHPRHLSMAPDVELTGRNIEIAADDQRIPGIPQHHVGGQTSKEVQLMRELAIDGRIRLIAPGRRISIVDLDAGDARGNTSGMPFTADVEGARGLKRYRGCDRDPMPTLLADDLQVGISSGDEGVRGESGRLAFYFLQAQDLRPLRFGKPEHLVEP
jgi:hypothetical protein